MLTSCPTHFQLSWDAKDFFRDYPPVSPGENGSAQPEDNAPAASDPMQPFILGEPESATNGAGIALSEPEPFTNGGPPPDEDEEPECPAVTEWRAAFAKGLEEKVMRERQVKAERAEKARKTLETMHARWGAARKDAGEANKKQEKEFILARDGVISRMSRPGEKPNWDIIPHLVDMTGKYKEGARDTSRMRQVLLRMKTN